ncbi:hypothetical protein Pst134EA_015275 [Puccinia striiformis f. sp. tritici]|uniref:hypothetical protein n=1 Tax=Puccinia striiformis f. sp. tritici TaxID=168172 RepID=UPI002007BCCB|nr:hypothetical protein Pst134EA_015275 [Puccinia striiformis f. sp. tritici]KAH9463192.1 hypothetical protein Pst134EA_015275 [Puccinia striiformis f. sp. tritici]
MATKVATYTQIRQLTAPSRLMFPSFPQKHGASGDTLLNSTEVPAQSSANTEDPHNCCFLPVESSASGKVALQACVLIDFLDPKGVHGLTNIKTSPTDSSLPLVCTETDNLTKKNIISIDLLPLVFTLPTDSSLPLVCTETNNVLTDTNMGDVVSDVTQSNTPAFEAGGSGSNYQQDDDPYSTANTFFLHHPDRHPIKPSLPDVSVPAARVRRCRKTPPARSPRELLGKVNNFQFNDYLISFQSPSTVMPAVEDLDRSRKRSKLMDIQKNTSAPRFTKPVTITSSDEEDKVFNFSPVITIPDGHPARLASASRDVPSYNQTDSPLLNLAPQPDPENQQLNLEDQQHYPEHQPKQLNPEGQLKQLNPENQQHNPEHQPKAPPQSEPLPQQSAPELAPVPTSTAQPSLPAAQPAPAPPPTTPSPPKYPQQERAAKPEKLTIKDIKKVMREFKCKWRYTDKKGGVIQHYKTLAEKQQEIRQQYLTATPSAQNETSLVDATSQLPTTDTLPVAPLQPNGCQAEKELSEPYGNIVDNDSIAAVAEIPDLINLSHGIAVVTD